MVLALLPTRHERNFDPLGRAVVSGINFERASGRDGWINASERLVGGRQSKMPVVYSIGHFASALMLGSARGSRAGEGVLAFTNFRSVSQHSALNH